MRENCPPNFRLLVLFARGTLFYVSHSIYHYSSNLYFIHIIDVRYNLNTESFFLVYFLDKNDQS